MEKYEKGSYKNSKIKISAPILNEEFELTDVSYYMLDIQDYISFNKNLCKQNRK